MKGTELYIFAVLFVSQFLQVENLLSSYSNYIRREKNNVPRTHTRTHAFLFVSVLERLLHKPEGIN